MFFFSFSSGLHGVFEELLYQTDQSGLNHLEAAKNLSHEAGLIEQASQKLRERRKPYEEKVR